MDCSVASIPISRKAETTINQQDRWNEKYTNRGPNLFQPEQFLVQRIHLFCPGSVLDVACGDGRHAIFLARSGFAVSGVDFSEQGLKRLETFAVNEGVHVGDHDRDLNIEGAFAGLGTFNNIIVIHFKPQLHTVNEMARILRPDGTLLMTSFNTSQHTEKGFRKDFCYTEGEYVDVNGSLELMEYTAYEDERGYFDGYAFRKK